MSSGWHLQLGRGAACRRWRVKRWPFLPPRLARALVVWGFEHRRDFPWRQSSDPFALLVAEMLLRQTRAGHVENVYSQLLSECSSPEQLAAADPERLRAILRPAGLVNQRTVALQEMARHLLTVHQGQVPGDPEALERIPHVGPYAANAVGNFSFGLPLPVVDANVIRVLDRFTGSDTPGPNPHRHHSIWEKSVRSLPQADVAAYNYALLDLGALVCTAKAPSCGECPLAPGCVRGRPRLSGP